MRMDGKDYSIMGGGGIKSHRLYKHEETQYEASEKIQHKWRTMFKTGESCP